MSNDRSVRFLCTLGAASTSRVLNLFHIVAINVDNPEHIQKPFFASPVLNQSFVLKHRTRADDNYLFGGAAPGVATKIIIPLDPTDLRAGGHSLFVEQRGFADTLRMVGKHTGDMLERDLAVLQLLNTIPSLDPFLLREHLRNHHIDVAPCYFAISEGDQTRMHAFVSQEMARLTTLAGGGSSSSNSQIEAMLSTEVDEKLGPLRETLGLSGKDFREGIFGWRGFLYYKWSMGVFWPSVMGVLREINTIQPSGGVSPDQKAYLPPARRHIIEMVRDYGNHLNKALAAYDASYADLVEHQSPKAFRDFLLGAPHKFLELGEKLGAISHVVSFWRYRFPLGRYITVDADDLCAIFQDFCSGFGEKLKTEDSVIRRPSVIDTTAA